MAFNLILYHNEAQHANLDTLGEPQLSPPQPRNALRLWITLLPFICSAIRRYVQDLHGQLCSTP